MSLLSYDTDNSMDEDQDTLSLQPTSLCPPAPVPSHSSSTTTAVTHPSRE